MIKGIDAPDGEKIWMVATECVMTLYALLFAFPNVPSALLDDVYSTSAKDEDGPSGSQWFIVKSVGSLLAVVEGMLKSSEVLEYSLPMFKSVNDTAKGVFMDMDALSNTFQLQF